MGQGAGPGRDKSRYNIHNFATLRAINLCVDNSNDYWYILPISVVVVIAVPISIGVYRYSYLYARAVAVAMAVGSVLSIPNKATIKLKIII